MNLINLAITVLSNEEALKKLLLMMQEIKDEYYGVINTYLKLIHDKIKNLEVKKEEFFEKKAKLSQIIEEKVLYMDQTVRDNFFVGIVYSMKIKNKILELSEIKKKYFLNNHLNNLELVMLPNNVKKMLFLVNIIQFLHPIQLWALLIIFMAISSIFIIILYEIILK